MSLLPKQDITQNLDTGEDIRIDDITGLYTSSNPGGYGAPNPAITAVNKVRFLFSSFLTERDAATGVTECEAGVEYIVTGSGNNTVEVNTKTYSLGDTFILMVDATPDIGTGLSLDETGRFAWTPDFLPPDYYCEPVPSEMGIDETSYPDSVYHSTYQLFTTEYLAGASFPAGTYIVKGDPLGIIEVDGVEYNVDEVFTTSGTETFTDTEGTNSVCLYVAEQTKNFPLIYNAWVIKNRIEQALSSVGCPCRQELQNALFEVNCRLAAIEDNYADDLNNDDSGTQTMLDEIAKIGVELSNLGRI